MSSPKITMTSPEHFDQFFTEAPVAPAPASSAKLVTEIVADCVIVSQVPVCNHDGTVERMVYFNAAGQIVS